MQVQEAIDLAVDDRSRTIVAVSTIHDIVESSGMKRMEMLCKE